MSNSMGVTAVVTADATQYDEVMKKAGAQAEATARTMAKAAKLQAEAEAFAAKFAGDAIDEKTLRIIEARQREKISLADYNKAQRLVKAGYTDEVESTKLLAAAYERLTSAREISAAAAKIETHESITGQQAASAAIRTLEGNTGIRAVERFLTTIPGLSGALKGIFPVIGMAATADILVKMGEDVYELEQKGKHAGEEISRAFGEMNNKLSEGNDELQQQIFKLEDEIAKLEGKPTNGLKAALMDAVIAANKLQDALEGVLKTQQQTLEQNKVGIFEGLLSRTAPTGDAIKDIEATGKDVKRQGEEARAARRKALQEAGEDQAKQEAANRAYYSRMDEISAEAARKMRQRATEIAERQRAMDKMAVDATKSGGAFTEIDLTPKRVSYEKAAETYDELQRAAQESGELFALQKKRDSLPPKGSGEAASRSQAEKRKAAMEAELTALKNDHNVSVTEEYLFWSNKVAAAKKGSAEWSFAYTKMGDANQALGREIEMLGRQLDAAARKREAALKQWDAAANQLADEMERADARASQAGARFRETVAETAMQLDQMQMAHDVATGAMTKYDALVQLAAQHVAEYREEMQRLDEAQAALNSRTDMLPGDRQAAQFDIDRQRTLAQGRADGQARSDSWALQQETAGGAARSSLEAIVAQSRDTAMQVRDSIDSMVRGLNDQILRGMTGQRTDFTGMARDMFSGLAASGINKAEGSFLQMFGIGKSKKPTGAPGDAIHTIVDNPLTGGAGQIPFGNLLPGMEGAGEDGKGGSFFSKAAGMLTGVFAGGFAEGGYAPPGQLMLVGERGPELMATGGGRTIIPNHAIPDLVGGGGSNYYTVDARGASDPAAVEAAVHRAISMAAPGIVAASVAAGQERNRRIPSTAPR